MQSPSNSKQILGPLIPQCHIKTMGLGTTRISHKPHLHVCHQQEIKGPNKLAMGIPYTSTVIKRNRGTLGRNGHATTVGKEIEETGENVGNVKKSVRNNQKIAMSASAAGEFTLSQNSALTVRQKTQPSLYKDRQNNIDNKSQINSSSFKNHTSVDRKNAPITSTLPHILVFF